MVHMTAFLNRLTYGGFSSYCQLVYGITNLFVLFPSIGFYPCVLHLLVFLFHTMFSPLVILFVIKLYARNNTFKSILNSFAPTINFIFFIIILSISAHTAYPLSMSFVVHSFLISICSIYLSIIYINKFFFNVYTGNIN